MSETASEADVEKMIVEECAANGWKYLPAAGIGRPERSVLLGVLRVRPQWWSKSGGVGEVEVEEWKN